MTFDYFGWAVLAALPAAVLYPIIYGLRVRWWSNWIGFALLVKASGLGIMLAFTAAILVFGYDYPGRTVLRNVGITLVAVGTWTAFVAMIREWRRR